MTINILGTNYTITKCHNSPRLEDMDGFCDETTKEIVSVALQKTASGRRTKNL